MAALPGAFLFDAIQRRSTDSCRIGVRQCEFFFRLLIDLFEIHDTVFPSKGLVHVLHNSQMCQEM